MNSEREYQERIAALELENKLLREKLDLLVRKVFGRSKEEVDSRQLTLLDTAGKVTAPAVKATGAARSR